MSVKSFFSIISAGYISHYRKNRIFLDEFYTDKKSERQKYDLVFPKNASGELGLILCIHGGAWIEGKKDAYTRTLFQVSEERGLAAACINYRYVSKDVCFGDELDDISSALTAIKAKGAEYGVSFGRVLLTGISAGGHLSLLYAYTRKASAPVEPVCVVELCGPSDLEHPFFYSEKNRINASSGAGYLRDIISCGAGCRIDPENIDDAGAALKKCSPVNFVDENTVPTVFGHGENDDIVPYQNAVDLDKKLTEHNVEHRFISFPDSNHACEDKKSMSETMKLFFEYADKYLK